MGVGRKTYTYSVDDTKKIRGLRKSDMAGVIFGCTHQTYKECVTQLIFGLPVSHFAYVQNIGPGMPLFLFNYSDRKMHGIFEATSCGQMNINPSGWTTDGAGKTQFPAQVCVRIMENCEPFSESAFKTIISENYYKKAHFWFELDHSQAETLRTRFLSGSNKRSNDIDFTKSSKSGTWKCKTAESSSNVRQTASTGTSLDYAKMGLDGNSFGDWTMLLPKDKDMPYRRGGDPWEESSESSNENITIDSDDENAAYGEIIESPTVFLNNKPESVEIGPASNGTVTNSSKENHELLVLEELKRLVIDRQNSLPSPTASECAKDDNNITIISKQFQNYIEQVKQETADVGAYVDKTHDEFQDATDIKELQNKNLLLEQKQGERDQPAPVFADLRPVDETGLVIADGGDAGATDEREGDHQLGDHESRRVRQRLDKDPVQGEDVVGQEGHFQNAQVMEVMDVDQGGEVEEPHMDAIPSELNEIRAKRDQVVGERNRLHLQVQTLQSQVDRQAQQIQTLQAQLDGQTQQVQEVQSLQEKLQMSEWDRIRYQNQRNKLHLDMDELRAERDQLAKGGPSFAMVMEIQELSREVSYYRTAVSTYVPGYHPYVRGGDAAAPTSTTF